MRHRTIFFVALAALVAVAPAVAQVTGSIDVNDERQQGASVGGNPLLFTPDPVRLGSSVSHWDDRAFPQPVDGAGDQPRLAVPRPRHHR